TSGRCSASGGIWWQTLTSWSLLQYCNICSLTCASVVSPGSPGTVKTLPSKRAGSGLYDWILL
ncbi:mCG20820, partial [Mus musculus]